ncbi:hypothetical protein NEHOM01_1562 [Nematocida homosporus]|uniref:uncharacterized protein n=1 Tax=Nematocida homosporus TaxID=1912981 RepID=UPI00221EEF3B|nr:uncharacterized protein NEHOM01_1562 [Nematocida homosporus]KAI5186576.1 hypothetical protein NEHOM01_1562 [Nematocida homosporus]
MDLNVSKSTQQTKDNKSDEDSGMGSGQTSQLLVRHPNFKKLHGSDRYYTPPFRRSATMGSNNKSDIDPEEPTRLKTMHTPSNSSDMKDKSNDDKKEKKKNPQKSIWRQILIKTGWGLETLVVAGFSTIGMIFLTSLGMFSILQIYHNSSTLINAAFTVYTGYASLCGLLLIFYMLYMLLRALDKRLSQTIRKIEMTKAIITISIVFALGFLLMFADYFKIEAISYQKTFTSVKSIKHIVAAVIGLLIGIFALFSCRIVYNVTTHKCVSIAAVARTFLLGAVCLLIVALLVFMMVHLIFYSESFVFMTGMAKTTVT